MANIEPLMIGCSKFFHGKQVVDLLIPEIKRLGGHALMIGGPSSVDRVWPLVADQAKRQGVPVEVYKHTEQCTRDWAQAYTKIAQEKGCTVIVGVGGGKVIDQAKCASVFADLPIITVPTSIATCVASSMVCIMYTAEGKSNGSVNLNKEIDVCIADEDLIGAAPPRLLASGMLDSMAKLPEVLQKVEGLREDELDVLQTIQTTNSRAIYSFLERNAVELYDQGQDSPLFGDVVLTNLIHTSLVSGFAAGSGQLAIAHGVYDNMRTYFTEEARPYLHGEIVAVGILVQMHFNGNPEAEIVAVRDLMKRMNMPCSMREIGFVPNDENIKLMCDALCHDTAVAAPDRVAAVKQALLFAL